MEENIIKQTSMDQPHLAKVVKVGIFRILSQNRTIILTVSDFMHFSGGKKDPPPPDF